jgi:hypothetical protein
LDFRAPRLLDNNGRRNRHEVANRMFRSDCGLAAPHWAL